MEVTSPNVLRSIANEAGRQADFYNRRAGAEAECQFWTDLEGLASEARRKSKSLLIEIRERSLIPIPIKHGEYHQQPQNALTYKDKP